MKHRTQTTFGSQSEHTNPRRKAAATETASQTRRCSAWGSLASQRGTSEWKSWRKGTWHAKGGAEEGWALGQKMFLSGDFFSDATAFIKNCLRVNSKVSQQFMFARRIWRLLLTPGKPAMQMAFLLPSTTQQPNDCGAMWATYLPRTPIAGKEKSCPVPLSNKPSTKHTSRKMHHQGEGGSQ